MRETYTDNSEDAQHSRDDRHRQTERNVPKRRGSKYADLLLQRLQNTILKERDSGLVGLVSHSNQQGVTTMAVNLAIRAADNGFAPSLVIDGNFNSRKVSRLYRCTGAGLGECLNGAAALNECASKTRIDGFFAMGAGKSKSSKQILFDSDSAKGFFKEVKNDFRLAVMDLPNLSEPSLNETVIPQLDGIVMVAMYGTRREELTQMQDAIVDAGGRILGLVMTGNQDKLPGWLPKIFS